MRPLASSWEQRKLGDVANIKTGDSDLQDAVPNGLYPFFVRSDKVERSNRYLFDGEAILVPGEGRLGEIFHYINGKFDYHQRVYKISNFVDVDAKFAMYSMMYGFKKHALENTAKATVDSIRLPTLTEFKFRVPCRDEQYQINVFFSRLDNLITLHQRKYDKLCAVKKSMLDKMFPKPGEIEPEIRFAGFTDPWEQRKLGEISESYSGGTPSAGKDEYYGGDIPFIRSAEIADFKTELFLTEEGYKSSSAQMVKPGDILYALYGATSGEVAVSKQKGAINQAILAILPTEKCDASYLASWLRSMKQTIVATYLQGGQGNLSGAIVKELEVPLPCIAEQKHIGFLFANLDNLITLHQRELNLLKNTKKSLLDKMFV